MVSDGLRLVVARATGLPAAAEGFTKPDDGTQTTLVQAVVGERGETWMEKIKAAHDAKGRTCASKKVKNKRSPTWNHSRWLDTSGIKDPELSLRVADWAPGGRTQVLGECAVPCRRVRSSSGLVPSKLLDIYGARTRIWAPCRCSGSARWRSRATLTGCRTGCRRSAGWAWTSRPAAGRAAPEGFMGFGLRVVGFLLLGQAGPPGEQRGGARHVPDGGRRGRRERDGPCGGDGPAEAHGEKRRTWCGARGLRTGRWCWA